MASIVPFLRPYYIFGVGLFFAAVLTMYAARDPLLSKTYHSFIYSTLFIIFLLAGYFFSQLFDMTKTNIQLLTSTLLFSTVLFVIGLYLFVTFYFPVVTYIKVVYSLLVFFIIFNAITIFYNVSMTPLTSNADLLTKVFFFIPCMVTDFLKYLFHDAAGTHRTTIFLIVAEATVIGLFFYLPQLLTRASVSGRVPILEGLMYLNQEVTIANSDLFHVQPPVRSLFNSLTSWEGTPPPDKDIVFNQSYSLSFWAFVNPTSLFEETAIFNYGNGKPALFFENDEQTGHYIAYFSNVNSGFHYFVFTLPLQTWNYFVYTYVNGTCEFYVNGTLVHVAELRGDQPTYHMGDTMTLGKSDGIYGAICNVSYYENPISPAVITTNYNMLSILDPPIFLTTNTTPTKSWYDYFGLGLLLLRDNRA